MRKTTREKMYESNEFPFPGNFAATQSPTLTHTHFHLKPSGCVACTNEFSTYVPSLHILRKAIFVFLGARRFHAFLSFSHALTLRAVTSCIQIFCIYWLVLDTSYEHKCHVAWCGSTYRHRFVSGVRRRFFTFVFFSFSLFIYSFFVVVADVAAEWIWLYYVWPGIAQSSHLISQPLHRASSMSSFFCTKYNIWSSTRSPHGATKKRRK